MSVHIKIDENLAIGSDTYQWMLTKKEIQKGEEYWRPISFYHSLDALGQAYTERSLRLSDAQSMAELRVEHENAVMRLSQALTPLNCIIQVIKK